jgi:hypothetical protein
VQTTFLGFPCPQLLAGFSPKEALKETGGKEAGRGCGNSTLFARSGDISALATSHISWFQPLSGRTCYGHLTGQPESLDSGNLHPPGKERKFPAALTASASGPLNRASRISK